MRKSNARFNTLTAAKVNASSTKVTNYRGHYVSPNCIMRETKGDKVAFCLRHVTSMPSYVAQCQLRGVEAVKIVTL